MVKTVVTVYLFLFSFANVNSDSKNPSIIIKDKWSKYFTGRNITGTFVLTKLNSDSLLIYNEVRAKESFLPASTFKILNSLISLETNVIEDENKIIKWDGKKRFYNKWNQDQNMKTAIKYSCVWFYQELARRVGKERMQHYLDTVKYGNSKLGKNIDTFCLEGELRISAIEQINFLSKLLRQELPFSDRNMEIVKNILLVDSTDSYKFYAKTGWAKRPQNDIGWYVGFITSDSDTWIFSMNIDIKKNEDAKERKRITEELLKDEGIIK